MGYPEVLSALADPRRRAILESLRNGALSVGALAELHPVSRPAVSQHLKVLQDAALVQVKAQGTKRLYSFEPAGLQALRTYLDGFWTDVLGAFAAEIATAATTAATTTAMATATATTMATTTTTTATATTQHDEPRSPLTTKTQE